jgi:type IV pilus assembly protein PilX
MNRHVLLSSFQCARPSLAAQRGVALIISLVLLLVMTIVGLAGIKMISGQEKMVGYAYDRSIAFQAAEATLRVVEDSIELAGTPTPSVGASCSYMGTPTTVMMCGAPSATATTPRWLDSSFTSWSVASTTVTSVVDPQYFVEYLGDTFPCGFDPSVTGAACKRYRVTVRADVGAGRANVMLQSVYALGS